MAKKPNIQSLNKAVEARRAEQVAEVHPGYDTDPGEQVTAPTVTTLSNVVELPLAGMLAVAIARAEGYWAPVLFRVVGDKAIVVKKGEPNVRSVAIAEFKRFALEAFDDLEHQ